MARHFAFAAAVSSTALLAACLPAAAAECVIPSKPGGAMDLTCKLAQKALVEKAALEKQPAPAPMRLSYMPGGIGAVAWHTMVSQRASEGDTLVAFSGGSLLNLAQGKFGKASAGDVRWVAALGADYGMIAVRADSSFKTLAELLARAAGVDPKALRFVALEGGGEAFTALDANYVQVVPGDASEATLCAGGGKVRVLAVLSERRLPGVLAAIPTAREQGVDVVWPIIRGVWMGPKASEADYQRWVAAFAQMQATPAFAQLRASYGFYPFSMTGAPLTAYIKQAVADYERQARQFNLVR